MQGNATLKDGGGPLPRDVDDCIEAAPDYARPILTKLREIIHRAVPDVTEVIKWGGACFETHGLLCGLAGFKHFVSLHFFRGAELGDPDNLFTYGEGNASSRTIKFSEGAAIPVKKIADLLAQAAALNRAGPPSKARREPKPVPDMPPEFAAALKKNKLAAKNYEAMSAACRREYLEWIISAKRPETRDKRIAQSIESLEHGRKAMDQYRRKD